MVHSSSSLTCKLATHQRHGRSCSSGRQTIQIEPGLSNIGPGPVADGSQHPHRRSHVWQLSGIEPHRVYQHLWPIWSRARSSATASAMVARAVFESEARAPKAADQPYRFVVFGDCGADTPEERAIAYRTFLAKPDFVMITGDIVYGSGLVSEYRTKYWPIYNSEEARA